MQISKSTTLNPILLKKPAQATNLSGLFGKSESQVLEGYMNALMKKLDSNGETMITKAGPALAEYILLKPELVPEIKAALLDRLRRIMNNNDSTETLRRLNATASELLGEDGTKVLAEIAHFARGDSDSVTLNQEQALSIAPNLELFLQALEVDKNYAIGNGKEKALKALAFFALSEVPDITIPNFTLTYPAS